MVTVIQDQEHEHAFSAHFGHVLAVTAVRPDVLRGLASLGIQDVEQLIAIAAVKDMSGLLATHLGLSDQELSGLVDEAKEVLPKGIAAKYEEPSDIEYPLGAFLEPVIESRTTKQNRINQYRLISAAGPPPPPLPPAVNHVASMLPIQQQGVRGTCVAFGSTALHEYYLTVSGKRVKLSEQFLYEEIKRIDGQPNACGTWLEYAIQVLRGLGQCEESVWPYNPNPPCNDNGTEPASARTNAAKYKAMGQMLSAKNVDAIKAALAGNSNVAFCIPVYDSWYRSPETVRSGRITMRIGNEPNVGGHCMCFVGYQDVTSSPGGGYFILRNSWGSIWGVQCPYGVGYGTIPYQYIANDATEAATIPGAAGKTPREPRSERKTKRSSHAKKTRIRGKS